MPSRGFSRQRPSIGEQSEDCSIDVRGRRGSRLIAGPCPRVVRPLALTGDPVATRAAVDFEALFGGAMRSSGKGF